jgi:hypothetical protein
MGIRGGRVRKLAAALGFAAFTITLLGAADQMPQPGPLSGSRIVPPAVQTPPQQAIVEGYNSAGTYLIRYDRWTPSDERGFGEFITGLGEANCRTVNDCLHSPGNPFRASDPPGIFFHSDCADLPYVLRAYYAWKRGLPFSYVSAVTPRGHARDIRYSKNGNEVVARKDVLSNSMSGYALLENLRDEISSATYRMHPDLDDPVPDLYSPAIDSFAPVR